MYLTFYGLAEKPFNLTPDPRFLYLSPGHREALAQLQYAIQERKGFMALTGPVGTGKTTLLNALRERLDGLAAVSFVFDSTLPFDGILEYVLEDLGVAKGGQTQAQRLMALNTFLIERERAGQNTVLVLDEAQNLSAATLEKIRLLSNFETPTSKLLQILLVGQPELRARLRLPELHQLRQRLALRCHISPLGPDDARQYIRKRLRTAGARDLGLFTDPAIARITEHARGIPRVINILCDHSLLFGYAERKRRIDRSLADQAIDYFEEREPSGRLASAGRSLARGVRRLRWALAALAAAGVAAVALRHDAIATLVVHPLREFLAR
jgi:general secretion pathway protein A